MSLSCCPPTKEPPPPFPRCLLFLQACKPICKLRYIGCLPLSSSPTDLQLGDIPNTCGAYPAGSVPICGGCTFSGWKMFTHPLLWAPRELWLNKQHARQGKNLAVGPVSHSAMRVLRGSLDEISSPSPDGEMTIDVTRIYADNPGARHRSPLALFLPPLRAEVLVSSVSTPGPTSSLVAPVCSPSLGNQKVQTVLRSLIPPLSTVLEGAASSTRVRRAS
jgi:hypothetical protein